MALSRTHGEYIDELDSLYGGDIVPLENYCGYETGLIHTCRKCGYWWKVVPEYILRGYGCPVCSGKKKNHMKYLEELREKHDNDIDPVERYDGANTKISHMCNICDYRWKAKPSNILSGKGCPKCAGNMQKSHDEYVSDLRDVHDNLIPLEKYQNNKMKILHKCQGCGYEWKVAPSNTLRGHGCPVCAGNKKINCEDYKDILSSLYEDKIMLIGNFDDIRSRVGHKCMECGYEWDIIPTSLIYNESGCPVCNGWKRTTEQYKEEVGAVHDDKISVLEEYKGSRVDIKHRCEICDNVWKAKPHNILHGTTCPVCSKKKFGKKMRLDQEVFVGEVEKYDHNIKVIGEYKGCNRKVKVMCKDCGRIWWAYGSNLLDGSGCICNSISAGEKRIRELLSEMEIDFGMRVSLDGCKYKQKLLFDFCVYNDGDIEGLVEFDGKQHYIPIEYFGGYDVFKEGIKRDVVKDEFCIENDIELLRLNYMNRDNNEIEPKLRKFLHDIGVEK